MAAGSAERLGGLRLVIVALSAVGLITTYSALEIFRFGGLSASLSAGIDHAMQDQARAARLSGALAASALSDTPEASRALGAAVADLIAAQPAEEAALQPALRDWQTARRNGAPPPPALSDHAARLTATTAERLATLSALWTRASTSLSQVLSLSLASIVVLLITVVMRSLAYLSARDRSEAELRRATARAEAANAAKSDFLATMSHEIRTPLTAIRGYAELLARTDLAPGQRDHLARLTDAGDALRFLIDDILDMAKIEAGEITLRDAPFDLPAVITRVITLVEPTARAGGLTLQADLAPDLPQHVTGDGPRLLQVLLNLAGNAVKFTPEGRVTLAAGTRSDRLVLSVSDTGIGIAAADLPKLFQRFSQVDGSLSRSHGGTGLGLAISRELVERMGGSIDVDSTPGAGSTFTVTLPLRAAALPATDQSATGPARHDTPPATILIVEDNPQNQDLIRAVLSRDGHRCTLATDGAMGVELAAAQPFDLIVMDMQMPRMDGIAATSAIRALPAPQGRTPILALTANVQPAQAGAMRRAGADAHLSKPFALTDLSAAVAALLGAHAQVTAVTDPAALAALTDLMGADWTRARLHAVLGDLAWLGEPLAPTELRRHAHRLIAEAGQLGLTSLGNAAATLQDRLDAGDDIAPARAALAAEARAHAALLPSLLARLDGAAPVQS